MPRALLASVAALALALLPIWSGAAPHHPAAAHKAALNDALMQAVGVGNVSKVKRLLAEGADVNGVVSGVRPLHMAVTRGQIALASLLLSHGADVNAPAERLGTPLHLAVAQPPRPAMVTWLLAHGANVDARDSDGTTPLSLTETVSVAALLLAHGADVNTRNKLGETPLHHAVLSWDGTLAEFLLTHGADVDARDKAGRTPLYNCVWGLNYPAKTVQVLLDRGANVNARDNQGTSVIQVAADRGDKKLVAWLREHGAKK